MHVERCTPWQAGSCCWAGQNQFVLGWQVHRGVEMTCGLVRWPACALKDVCVQTRCHVSHRTRNVTRLGHQSLQKSMCTKYGCVHLCNLFTYIQESVASISGSGSCSQTASETFSSLELSVKISVKGFWYSRRADFFSHTRLALAVASAMHQLLSSIEAF